MENMIGCKKFLIEQWSFLLMSILPSSAGDTNSNEKCTFVLLRIKIQKLDMLNHVLFSHYMMPRLRGMSV